MKNSDEATLKNKTMPWDTPTDDQQKKVPLRVAFGLVIGVVLYLGPYMALVGVLIPQKVAAIDPTHKAAIIAIMSTATMIIATFSNIIEGALSDRTRSRWGRRTPWLIAGSIGSAAVVLLWGRSTSGLQIIIWGCVFNIFLNMIVAPLVAIISDRVSHKYRGTISSIWSVGSSMGQYGGQAFAALFLPIPYTGFIVMATLLFLCGPLASLVLREQSTKNMEIDKITLSNFSKYFVFPTKGAHDFYMALFGKLAIQTAEYAISGYQLYILTDYIRLHGATLQSYISMLSMIMMITAIILSTISGPISDKIGRRKLPVIFASVIIAAGALSPFFTKAAWIMLVYAVIVGMGKGIASAVEQALNIEVLPDATNAAKDLGLLNMANTGGQVLGPVLAATAISVIGYHGIFPLACALALVGGLLISRIKGIK